MRDRLSRHWSVTLFILLLTVLAVTLVESLDASQKTFLRESIRARAKEELSIVRSELESAIVSDIYVANGLSALIAANPEFEFSGWDLMASSIMRKSRHIRVVGLAPNDVIKYIYPLEGNERAIGLDYHSTPDQRFSVQKAREVQEIFIAGPVDLVQGGKGLIARVPIFEDPPYNMRYWGVCSAVIELESLFQEASVEAFEHKYQLAMRGTDSSGEEGELFYGKQSTFDDAFAIEHVYFPYGSWVIAATEKGDLLSYGDWYSVHAVRLIGYPMILALLLSFGQIFRLYSVANRRSLQDELTLLPNRRYFMYTLQNHFESAKRNNLKDCFAILSIDLDKFKSINDTHGHGAGDKVLIATSERIQGVLRSSDVVARIGGDEFLILLPRMASKHDVEYIKSKLEKAISHSPVIYDQHLIDLQVSIGCALYAPEYEDVEDMLREADTSMYLVKRRHARSIN